MNSECRDRFLLPFYKLQLRSFFLISILVLIPFSIAAQVETDGLSPELHSLLSEEELIWLKEHPRIRIGCEPDYAPFIFVRHGRSTGYSIDLLDILLKMTGLEAEYLQREWSELLLMIQRGEVDLLSTTSYTEARASYLEFSDPYYSEQHYLYVREGLQFPSDKQSFLELKGVVTKGDLIHELLQQQFPELHLQTPATYLRAIETVNRGVADFTILEGNVAAHLIEEHQLGKVHVLNVPDFIEFEDVPQFHFAARKDWGELAGILSKAMQLVGVTRMQTLRERWFYHSFYFKRFSLTAEEKAWLDEHPVVTAGYDPDWHPFDFSVKMGEPMGISVEFLRKIGQMTGIRFDFVHGKHWGETVDWARSRKVDFLSAVAYTPERGQFLDFTDSYVDLPVAIFTRDDVAYVGNLNGLSGKKIGVVNGYAIEEYVRDRYPAIELLPSDSPQQALQLLASGETFAYLGNLFVTANLISESGYRNIKISGNTEFSYELCFGVRDDWPLLASVMNKALNGIPEPEKEQILDQWLSVPVHQSQNWQLILSILIPILIGVFISLVWNVLLVWQVKRRKAVELQLSRQSEQLKEHARKAESDSRAKSLFLANISHEIRTPLNAVIGYSKLLEEATDLSAGHRELVRTINQGGEHLLTLINDVLEISRIESGKIRVEHLPFNVAVLMDQMDSMFSFRASEKGVELKFDLDCAFEVVVSDEIKIRQILVNLIGNALKFTGEGGVSVHCSVASPQEPPYPAGTQAHLRFEVRDSGPGIPQEDRERIFGSFEQTDSGYRTEGSTGLGLAISSRFAQALSGVIAVQSEVGEGACFTVEIPVVAGEPDAPYQTATSLQTDSVEPKAAAGARILIADDIESNRKLLTIILRKSGFVTDTAANGQETLNQIDRFAPDLVLLDIKMPGMDGYEVIRQAGERKDRSRYKIIAVTAGAFEEERQIILNRGADGFVKKPVRKAELFREIGKFLQVESEK